MTSEAPVSISDDPQEPSGHSPRDPDAAGGGICRLIPKQSKLEMLQTNQRRSRCSDGVVSTEEADVVVYPRGPLSPDEVGGRRGKDTRQGEHFRVQDKQEVRLGC
jgi:hypothetical protein